MYVKFYTGFLAFLDLLKELNFSKFIACCLFAIVCIFIRNMIIYLLNK